MNRLELVNFRGLQTAYFINDFAFSFYLWKMQFSAWKKYICMALVFLAVSGHSQSDRNQISFFEPADTFNRKRFNLALTGAAVGYTGFSIALYNTWYKNYEQTSFHFFDDGGEWNDMDKAGHIYTAYFQGILCYKGAKWTGLSENKSIMVGAICGSLFQSTIEMMDGFSEEWGFSWYDFGANVVGVSAFALQQKYWAEQKFAFKVSSWPKSHSPDPLYSEDMQQVSSLEERADDLFGDSYAEKFLKDYNAQTIWLSANIRSIFPKAQRMPGWLNLAFGYGSENMYGGFENRWMTDDAYYSLDDELYPRYRQYYLSLDIDLTRIKTKSPFLKTLFSVFNIFKIPAPAIEYNSLGEFQFHLLFL